MSIIMRLDMNTRQVESSELPTQYERLAGRALTSQICQDEVEPLCYPLGEKNKFIVAPGLLSGEDYSFAGRVTMGGKSPLTRGVAASNGGGMTATNLAALGIRALIVEGLPSSNELYILVIRDEKAEIIPANELQLKGTCETTAILQEKYGREAAIFCIGPAGEMLMPTAAVINTDVGGTPNRVCGRGGLGAVMGSKRLKAVVIAKAQNNQSKMADQQSFAVAAEKLAKILNNTETMGREAQVALASDCLPKGDFVDGFSSAPVKPETARTFRDYCKIDDWASIVSLNETANDLGIDTLESAATIRILMQNEIIPWGDGAKALQLLQEVAEGTSLGHLIGQGSRLTIQAMGSVQDRYIPNRLANDNTGLCMAAALQEDKENVITNQFLDISGLCLYAAKAFLHEPKSWSALTEMINAKYGWQLSSTALVELSRASFMMEEKFNLNAGFAGRHNSLGGYLPQDFYVQTINYPSWQEQGFTFTSL